MRLDGFGQVCLEDVFGVEVGLWHHWAVGGVFGWVAFGIYSGDVVGVAYWDDGQNPPQQMITVHCTLYGVRQFMRWLVSRLVSANRNLCLCLSFSQCFGSETTFLFATRSFLFPSVRELNGDKRDSCEFEELNPERPSEVYSLWTTLHLLAAKRKSSSSSRRQECSHLAGVLTHLLCNLLRTEEPAYLSFTSLSPLQIIGGCDDDASKASTAEQEHCPPFVLCVKNVVLHLFLVSRTLSSICSLCEV